MRHNTYKKITFSVGIPTYYGGESLVRAVKSILSSKNVGKFEIVVTVDGNPLERDIKQKLLDLGIKLIENKERGGQVARIKQLIALAKAEVLVLTQDDVLFSENTLSEILKGFANDKITMVSGKVQPLKATNIIERIIQTGVSISYTIGRNWSNSDNYFLAGGRCLAFRTSFIKKFSIPNEILNSDTYLYFHNQQMGGKFLHVPKAVYYMRSPKKLSDHLKQSKKYQFVPAEIKKYLNIDVSSAQPLSKKLELYAFLLELVKNPFFTLSYMGVMIYTRIVGRHMYDHVTRFWETDASTKEL